MDYTGVRTTGQPFKVCSSGNIEVFTNFPARIDCRFKMSTETPMSLRRPEKKTDKKTLDNPLKTSEKRYVQLNLNSASTSIKNSVVSDKQPQKKQRSSSSDIDTLNGTPDLTRDLNNIQQSLLEIRQTMVNKSELKDIVKSVIAEVKSELKDEIKKEILAEVSGDLKNNLKSEITDSVRENFDLKIDKKTKEFECQVKEVSDGFNLDFDTLREKLHEQNKELRSLKETIKECEEISLDALKLANQNLQYSQKNNIKFMGWKEQKDENLRMDLCTILKEKAGVALDPNDVLEIHRLPQGNRGGIRPVIAKFKSTEVKVKVIKNRSKEEIKKCFTMYDHITPMNAKLIHDLNKNPQIQSAWLYNGKVFALDKDNKRHRFDIFDNVNMKVKH